MHLVLCGAARTVAHAARYRAHHSLAISGYKFFAGTQSRVTLRSLLAGEGLGGARGAESSWHLFARGII